MVSIVICYFIWYKGNIDPVQNNCVAGTNQNPTCELTKYNQSFPMHLRSKVLAIHNSNRSQIHPTMSTVRQAIVLLTDRTSELQRTS